MNYDREEIVSLNGASMTLRTAIAKVMALVNDKRYPSPIFRDKGKEPPIFDLAQIEAIAELPEFKSPPH